MPASSLPSFPVVGNLKEIFGEVISGQLVERSMYRARVVFKPNVADDWLVSWHGELKRILPVTATVDVDGNIVSLSDSGTENSDEPVRLLAQDDSLSIRGLQWQVNIYLPAQLLPSAPSGNMKSFWFNAPAANTTVSLASIVPAFSAPPTGVTPPSGGGGGASTVDDLTDAGTVGKSVVRSTTKAAARNAISAVADDDGRLSDARPAAAGSVNAASLAAALLVTAAETIAANDNDTTLPSSAAVRQHVAARIAALIGSAPAELDTWIELVSAIQADQSALAGINTSLSGKADKSTVTALATTVNGKADQSALAALGSTVDGKQPLAATLTALAALATTDFGRSLLTQADAGAVRSLIVAVSNADARLSDARQPVAGSVTTAALATALLVTASKTIAANDNDTTIPTSAAVRQHVAAKLSDLIGAAPAELDTWIELVSAIQADQSALAGINTALSGKYAKPASGIPLADLVASVQTQLGLASTARQPMPTLATITATGALTAGAIQPVNAQGGALAVTLPARSAANDNAYFGAQKASADSSVNAVTITPAGSDVFDSGAASVALRLPGELRIVQAVTIGSVRQWKVVGGNTTVSSLDARFQSLSMVRRPLNNRSVGAGDSITELGTDGLLYNPQNGEGWLPRLCIASRQRIRWDGIYAKGGATLINVRDTWLPQILALNPRPGACFLFAGTNSQVIGATPATLAANVAVYMQIIEPLMAAGILPICVTIPPNDLSSGQFGPSVRQWNRWIRRFAQRNGFPLLDAYTACAAVNGSWKTGYSNDQLHPNGVGMKAIADQGIADGLPAVFSPNGAQLTVRDTLDLTNAFGSGSLNWGLFTTQTNGVGTGLTLAGTGTASIVAAIAADGIMGSWQRVARASADAGSGLVQVYAIVGGWTPGDTLSLSFRVRTANVTAASPVTVGTQITKTGGFTQNGQNVSSLKQGLVNLLNDVEGTVHVEFTIPAGAEALVLNSIIIGNTSGQTVTVDMAEVSIVNLTTNGVLV